MNSNNTANTNTTTTANNTKWTKGRVTALLVANPKAVERAILALYRRQTEDEKLVADTRHLNHVGFSAADASYGTYVAKYLLNGGKLSGSHKERALKLALRYTRQLADEANFKAQNARAIEASRARAEEERA